MAIDLFHNSRVQRMRQSACERKKGEEDYQKWASMPYLDVTNGVMNHTLWFIIILVYNNG